jgi:hypothetical protein
VEQQRAVAHGLGTSVVGGFQRFEGSLPREDEGNIFL